MRLMISFPAALVVLEFCAAPALNAGLVYVWGENIVGQLGDGTRIDRSIPGPVSGLAEASAIAAGGYHSLVVLVDGTVRGWGGNNYGQLGDGTTTDRLTPVTVNGLSNVTSIAAGYGHSLALLSNGSIRAWGYNADGELGDGTLVYYSTTPVPVSGLAGATSITAGAIHSLALLSDGTLLAWGDNEFGQLGNTTKLSSVNTPIAVSGLANVTAIAAGYYHSLALLSDGTVRAWGSNGYGQLGDGTTSQRTIPVAVSGLGSVRSVAAGALCSLAVMTDGTVRAWGDNQFAELGDGTFTNRTSPVIVPGLSNIVAVEADYLSSFALSADGRLWAWGDNTSGELGIGDLASGRFPTEVHAPAGFRFTAIAGGQALDHAVALLAPVPEPSTVVLAALGAIGLLALFRRRVRAAHDPV